MINLWCLWWTLQAMINLWWTLQPMINLWWTPRPMIHLWCYIEGQHDVFQISISPNVTNIDGLRKLIYDNQINPIAECASSRLTLIKVHYIMISLKVDVMNDFFRTTSTG